MRDLRPTTNAYWLLRQFKLRTGKEFALSRLGYDAWLAKHIYEIGKAIMYARAIEIKEKAA